MGKLDGKVAIITGAGSGFGRATTLLFTQEGASVLVVDRDEEGAQATIAEVEKNGGSVSGFVADVTRSANVAAMVRVAVERYGKLDILYNNAGIGTALVPAAMLEEEAWDAVLATNLKSVFLGAKYAFPELEKNGGGVMLNTASVAGIIASPGFAAYGASKAGVIHLTKILALEGAALNIRVNAICPGWAWTPLVSRGASAAFPGAEEQIKQMLAKTAPMNRLIEPEEVAKLALYLASDDAKSITGAAHIIDAGISAGRLQAM
jgi:NAD(P)-dependent dehydrogenase (short-subunit alcohol dehydrogenase family)